MNTSEIGLIFGIFELVMFITAPFLGKYVCFFNSAFSHCQTWFPSFFPR